MARVLIAWELGEAFGHLAQCLQLTQCLIERGHQVMLVLKDIRLPAGASLPPGATILPAPLTPDLRPSQPNMPVNYAGMLRYSGFANAADLAARLTAWQGIFSLACPALLVADHAPTALLAAHLAGIPHVSIGNGFAIPPDCSPWPSIRPWETISNEALVAAETALNEVTQAAQETLGYPTPATIRTVFAGPHVLDTFAELDHYGERPDGNYAGPIISMPKLRRTSWQTGGDGKILAYLRPEIPRFTSILQALAKLDAQVICIAPGLSGADARRFATRRLRISLAPLDLEPLLSEADLAIGYGNSGFSTQALLAGVPLLMRPRHVEQALMARRVEALGAGKLLDGRIEMNAVQEIVQEMLDQATGRQAAQAFRARHRGFSLAQALERTVAVIEQAVHGAPETDRPRTAHGQQEIPKTWIH